MKVFTVTGLLVVFILGGLSSPLISNQQIIDVPFRAVPDQVEYVPDEFIVVLTDGAGTPAPTNYRMSGRSGLDGLDVLAEAFTVEYMKPQFIGAAGRGHHELSRFYKVKFAGSRNLQEVMDAYASDPAVDHVEPIGIHPLHATPNDGHFPSQWHLHQDGGPDMDLPQAWDTETGDSAIVVAILDSGVRYYHRDLGGINASYSNPEDSRGNMWINWAEKNGTPGVDDDSNGYTDDWIGYDFVNGASDCWPGEDCSVKDNDPRDFGGHGTHCAGNVAAINNNNRGTCSPSGGWNGGTETEFGNGVKVMACRVGYSVDVGGEEYGYVRMDFCAEGFYYAANNGAHIVSCSWGSSNSGGLGTAVTIFINGGGLVFSSAGNNNNQTASYLCSRTDVVSVAATDADDCKASFSNYGTWVDVAAPGVNILSLYHAHDTPESDFYAYMGGTSMACPLAASVAALIWSKNPTWTAGEVRNQLEGTTDYIYGLGCNFSYIGKLGSGRVNALKAISCCRVQPFEFDWTGSSSLYVGEHADTTFIIINDGCTSISGTVSESCDHFSILSGAGAYSISNGDTHFVTIRYEPTAAGTHECTIETGNPDCSDVSCSGQAWDPPCSVYPDSLDFGEVAVGSYTTRDFHIRNNTGIFLSGTVTPLCSRFIVTAGGTYNISPGDSQLVSIGFIPMSAGRDTCWIDTGDATCSDVFCEGIAAAAPACLVEPDTLDFGDVLVGGQLDSTFSITNDGGGTVAGSVSEACTHFSIVSGSGAYSLTTGQSHDVTVRYQPGAAGPHSCTIETGQLICSDVVCIGNGVEPAACQVQPDTLDFGIVSVNDSLDLTFLVINIGGDTLRGDITESCGQYSIVSGAGPYALAGSETLWVDIRFRPPDIATYECTIETGAAICSDVFCTGEGDPMSPAGGAVPLIFALQQNHPNPFNPATTISFSLPEKLHAELTIFNLNGQRVRTLVNKVLSGGINQAVWNGRDASGNPVSSGVYFYRLKAGSNVQTRKMVLLK